MMISLGIRTKDDPWGCYYEGYCELVVSTLEYLQENSQGFNTNMMYPLLFNIRHVIELGLKDILAQLRYIHGNLEIIMNHNLTELLELVHQELCNHDGFTKDFWVSYFEVIKQQAQFFIDNDSLSFNFRYPATKSNQPAVSDSLVVSLEQISSDFSEIRYSISKISNKLMTDTRNDLNYFNA